MQLIGQLRQEVRETRSELGNDHRLFVAQLNARQALIEANMSLMAAHLGSLATGVLKQLERSDQIAFSGNAGTSQILARLGSIERGVLHNLDISDQMTLFDNMARELVTRTPSKGLVSPERKVITVKLAMRALLDRVPGDFVETGVFRGGTAILMAKVLLSGDSSERVLWAADSFQGLPEEDVEGALQASAEQKTPSVLGNTVSTLGSQKGEFSSGREIFENNLAKNNLSSTKRIKVLQGWFNDTLPNAPIQSIAFLRLDGDIFISTIQVLEILYEKVSLGGYIYVDDYGSYAGCAWAVDKYRREHGIVEPMIPVYEKGWDPQKGWDKSTSADGSGKFEAVWWRKPI